MSTFSDAIPAPFNPSLNFPQQTIRSTGRMTPAGLLTGELQDCEPERSPEASPAAQWAAAPNYAGEGQSSDSEHQHSPQSAEMREIRRNPQSVAAVSASSYRHGHFVPQFDAAGERYARSGDYHTAESLRSDSLQADSLNMESVRSSLSYDDDDDDDEHDRTLLSSLPTPSVRSSALRFTSESPAPSVMHAHSRSHSNTPDVPSPAMAGSQSGHSPQSSGNPNVHSGIHSHGPSGSAQPGIPMSHMAALRVPSPGIRSSRSHSPQDSQLSLSGSNGSQPHLASSSHAAGSQSPKIAPTRPRSAIGNRAANRQSYYDFSGAQSHINLSLSDAVAQQSRAGNALQPRIKTIELYRKNARKTNDPELEFQLAQYMMQTALMASSGAFRAQSEESTATEGSAATDDTAVTKGSKGETDGKGDGESKADSKKDEEAKFVASLSRDAMNSLKRLSERGYADAQYLLGDVYSSGAFGNKPDMERSFKYLLMAAKHGHGEAAYRTALCLQEGWGTTRDAARALQFYHKAAVRNQPGALYQLGMAYFYSGMGLTDSSANRLTGVKWLSRATNVSNTTFSRAPHELAKIYEVGFKDLVLPDENYAVKLYTHAAELGFVPSAARLGRAYEYAELGCPQDANLSIHYYTIAALGNDPKAQLSMAAWYMVGAGPTFPVNHDEAYEWALRAALNGLPKGQYTLGFFYESGTGTLRNIVEAGKWYKRAADGGYEKAATKLASLGVPDADKRRQKCTIM